MATGLPKNLPEIVKGSVGGGSLSYSQYIAKAAEQAKRFKEGTTIDLETTFPKAEYHYASLSWTALRSILNTQGISKLHVVIDNGGYELRDVNVPPGRSGGSVKTRQVTFNIAGYGVVGPVEYSGLVLPGLKLEGVRPDAGTSFTFRARVSTEVTGRRLGDMLFDSAYQGGKAQNIIVEQRNLQSIKNQASDYFAELVREIYKNPAIVSKLMAESSGGLSRTLQSENALALELERERETQAPDAAGGIPAVQ